MQITGFSCTQSGLFSVRTPDSRRVKCAGDDCSCMRAASRSAPAVRRARAGGRIHGVFLLGRDGGESLQPGHSRSERSNSSDTDFEGQIWHRQSGHSGTGTCCTTLPRRPPPVGVDRKDASSPTTFRLATFWRATSATIETPTRVQPRKVARLCIRKSRTLHA
eukprot:COSAG02_NODE_2480_length_8727_cov_7.654381_3_plen_163_part_00